MVDDAHWLDDTSAILVHQLAAAQRAFVLVTLRTGEPVAQPILNLWKDRVAERIEVAPLDQSSVHELLSAVMRGPFDGATVHRLAERSGGNLLYLRELVLDGVERGVLSDQGGVWRLSGPLPVSDRLTALVEARLAGLDGGGREVMELLAHGEPLGVGVLQDLSDARELDGLERRGFLSVTQEGQRLQCRPAHPLYGEVLRAQTPVLRSLSLKRALADWLETAGARRREDALRVAVWRLDAGGKADADIAIRAAQTARDRWDLPLAERLALAAIAAGAGFEAEFLAAQLCWLQGRGEEAEARLAGLTETDLTDAERAMVAATRMDTLSYGLSRWDEALLVGEEAEAAISERACRDQVTAQRARLFLVAGRTRSAFEVVEPLVSRTDPRTLAAACPTAATTRYKTGLVDAAVRVTEQGAAAHLALAGPGFAFGAWVHPLIRAVSLSWAGRFDEAERLGTEGYAQASVEGDWSGQAGFSLALAYSRLLRGCAADAVRHGRETLNLYRSNHWAILLRFAAIPVVHALALLGDIEQARSLLAEIDAMGFPPSDESGADLLRSRAWTDVAAGDIPRARTRLEEAVEMSSVTGDTTFGVAALHDLARLGRATDVVARMTELTAEA
ncbi:MAG: hypothetical protein ACR2KK_09385 [Acidimicrobiales bacterium]